MVTQEIIDSLLPMKDPDERIAVIAPNPNQFDYFIRKLSTVSRVRVPKDCYVHIGNPDRLRGVHWTKVLLLNNPKIDHKIASILDHLKGKGIPVIEITDRDI